MGAKKNKDQKMKHRQKRSHTECQDRVVIRRNNHIIEVKGEGHCMYQAICVANGQAEKEYQKLRNKVKEFLLIHREMYEPLILAINPLVKYEDYLNKVETSQWGDEIELSVCAIVLEVNIRVVTASNDTGLLYGESFRKQITIGFLADEEHYVSIR